MESVVNLLRKVPAALRFLVLIVLAFLTFYVAFQGLTDGSVFVGILGLLAFLFIGYVFYYLIVGKKQL